MKKSILTTFLLLATVYVTYSQIIFDMCDTKNASETIDLKTKPMIKITGLLPDKTYSVSIEMNEEEIPKLTYATLSGASCPQDATNKPLLEAIGKLKGESDEGKVVCEDIKDIEAKRDKLDKTRYADCIQLANAIIAQTIYIKDLGFELRNNQTITVTVKRGTKTWTKTFTTPEKTPWLIHYGFNYQPNWISKYDQFYSQQIGKTDSFYVAKKSGHQTKYWQNLSPTIMFTYPLSKKETDIKLGFTAIASTNFSSFSGGIGFSAIIGYNIVVGTGVHFSQKYVLRGEYKSDGTQVVKSNLSFDQLHEKQWGPEWFFTLGFRFDKNPFSAKDKSKDKSDQD